MGPALDAGAGDGPQRTLTLWRAAGLTGVDGAPRGRAPAFAAWPLAGEREGRPLVRLPDGGLAWAEPDAGLVLEGPPELHRARLERLAAAPPSPETARRLAAGRLEAGDSQWTAELAWGPPWQRYMVNLFQDEEHLVYRDPAGQPILLRFRAGQLQPSAPARPPWVAAPPPGR